MPFLSGAALFRPGYKHDKNGALEALPATAMGHLVYDSADPVHAAVSIATDDATPGVNTDSGYPGYTRATGSFLTDLYAVGDYVRVTGAAADVNGSTSAPKVFRIAYLTALTMGVEGPNAAGITTVTTAAGITIRKVRLFRLADIRSIQGAAHPLTWQAVTSPAAATYMQASLDDGKTWDSLPKVLLPDTNNSSAKIVQFSVGYDALLMVLPGASVTGKMYVA